MSISPIMTDYFNFRCKIQLDHPVNECEQMCFPTCLLCRLDQNISLPLSATLLDEYCLLNRTEESPLGSECPLLSLLL